nr:MAG TPA: hypothetical protein [Caudoviricetes sp.]
MVRASASHYFALTAPEVTRAERNLTGTASTI